MHGWACDVQEAAIYPYPLGELSGGEDTSRDIQFAETSEGSLSYKHQAVTGNHF